MTDYVETLVGSTDGRRDRILADDESLGRRDRIVLDHAEIEGRLLGLVEAHAGRIWAEEGPGGRIAMGIPATV